MAGWAAGLGYKGIQIPTWDGRLFDLKKAASSKTYCDEVKGDGRGRTASSITELSTHLQGQLVAVNPVYDAGFDAFAAPEVRGNPKARTKWAIDQVKKGAKACANLGLDTMVTFTGAFAWPFLYPFPQRPAGLIETAFDELAKRWKPIFDYCDEQGVDVGFELHPSEDLLRRRHLRDAPRAGRQPSALRHQLRSLALRAAVPRLSRVHRHLSRAHLRLPREGRRVQPDRPAGRLFAATSPGSTAPAASARSATARSISAASSPSSPQYDYDGWAVLEWECALKHPEDGAREGAEFIKAHIIRVTEKAFDDFADAGTDQKANRKMLGI